MPKNNLITAAEYAASATIEATDKSTRRPMIRDIYQRYASRCKKAGAMDFDDLLLNTNILFRDNPDILDKYMNIFRYILVDEYQDTNYSQYLIVKKLAQQHRNVCVVGDDAQSIYSFRGARIENILTFRSDYPRRSPISWNRITARHRILSMLPIPSFPRTRDRSRKKSSRKMMKAP